MLAEPVGIVRVIRLRRRETAGGPGIGHGAPVLGRVQDVGGIWSNDIPDSLLLHHPIPPAPLHDLLNEIPSIPELLPDGAANPKPEARGSSHED